MFYLDGSTCESTTEAEMLARAKQQGGYDELLEVARVCDLRFFVFRAAPQQETQYIIRSKNKNNKNQQEKEHEQEQQPQAGSYLTASTDSKKTTNLVG